MLVKFILRRERVSLIIWILCLSGLIIYMPFIYEGLYATVAERYAAMLLMQNPAVVAIVGPSMADASLGALFTQEVLVVSLVSIAIMNILLVNKHTRTDEELGRLELIRSFPVSSTSILHAVFIVVIIANVILGGLIALGLALGGVESITVGGSILFGAIITTAGLLFATITAIFAQLFSTAKASSSYAFMTLLVMYLVRAVGDVAENFLSYISPLGLLSRTAVFVDNLWWPIVVVLVQIFIIGGSSIYLNSNRDLGMGLIPAKLGPRKAAQSLLSLNGLAWRLQRGSMIVWLIGSFVIGLAYGAIIGVVETYIGDNEMVQAILATAGDSDASMTDQFIPFLIVFLVIMLLIPLVGVILKLAGEEKRHLSEQILARAVARRSLLISYWLISMIASVLLFAAGAFGFWLGGLTSLEDPIALRVLLSAISSYLPAAWILIGLAVLLIGWLPKFISLATLMIGFTFFIVFFGELLELPQFVIDLSPLTHVPNLPIEDASVATFFIMSMIAALMMIVGFIGYCKRDMNG